MVGHSVVWSEDCWTELLWQKTWNRIWTSSHHPQYEVIVEVFMHFSSNLLDSSTVGQVALLSPVAEAKCQVSLNLLVGVYLLI